MSQLDQTATLGLDELNCDMMDASEVEEEEAEEERVAEEIEVEEVDDPVGTYESQGSAKRCRTQNYSIKLELFNAGGFWMNSMHVLIRIVRSDELYVCLLFSCCVC